MSDAVLRHQASKSLELPSLPTKTYIGYFYAIHVSRNMTMSSIGNIFHVTGPLCGEFTGLEISKPCDEKINYCHVVIEKGYFYTDELVYWHEFPYLWNGL